MQERHTALKAQRDPQDHQAHLDPQEMLAPLELAERMVDSGI